MLFDCTFNNILVVVSSKRGRFGVGVDGGCCGWKIAKTILYVSFEEGSCFNHLPHCLLTIIIRLEDLKQYQTIIARNRPPHEREVRLHRLDTFRYCQCTYSKRQPGLFFVRPRRWLSISHETPLTRRSKLSA